MSWFPQLSYLDALREKARVLVGQELVFKIELLTDDEKIAWYSYMYGWRRVARNELSSSAPFDPAGKFFQAWMVDEAEREWRISLAPPVSPPVMSHRYRIAAAYQLAHGEGQTLPAGLSEDDPQVLVWLARLDERESAFRAKIARRPEESDDEHVTRIAEIARANIGAFVKNTRVRRKGKGDQIARVHAELGTHAAPRAVEDPAIAAMVEGWREEIER